MRPEAELWWKQAMRDMETARHCRGAGDHYAAAFFCQQLAAKALKALYIHKRQQSPGPGHSLIFLGRETGAPVQIMTFLRQLNPEYVVSRYPDAANGLPHENYDEAISGKLVAGVEEVLRWIDSQIPRLSPS